MLKRQKEARNGLFLHTAIIIEKVVWRRSVDSITSKLLPTSTVVAAVVVIAVVKVDRQFQIFTMHFKSEKVSRPHSFPSPTIKFSLFVVKEQFRFRSCKELIGWTLLNSQSEYFKLNIALICKFVYRIMIQITMIGLKLVTWLATHIRCVLYKSSSVMLCMVVMFTI